LPATTNFRLPFITASLALLVTACGGGSSSGGESSSNVSGSTVATQNTIIADAGPDQSVGEMGDVVLNGAGSSDTDGSNLTYTWRQISGTSVDLIAATTVSPNFVAPDLLSDEILTLELTVSDGVTENVDTVEVAVTAINEPPVLIVNAVTSALGGTAVALDGTGTSDPDDFSALTYLWSQTDTSGVTVDISDATSNQASFVSPRLFNPVTLEFQLTIADGAGNTDSETVSIVIDLVKFEGENPGDYFDKVGAAGDVNQDGFSDVVIGARGYDGNTGKIYVYSGKDSSLLFSKIGEEVGSRFGVAVDTAGDFNSDGYADVIVGADSFDSSGKAYVYSGEDYSLLFSVVGENPDDNLGSRVAGVGDFNADGFSDVVIGITRYDGVAGTDTGKIVVYSGIDSSLLFSSEGEQADYEFGYGVSGAGDFNGDGFSDVIGSTYGSSGVDPSRRGKVYIYSGFDQSSIFYNTGENAGDKFGVNISRAGDFNADGRDDIVVGAEQYDGIAGQNSGKIYVYSGLDGSLLFSIEGENSGDNFGGAVSFAGDFNFDGNDDVVATSLNYDGVAGNNSGKIYIYSGADQSLLFSMEGEKIDGRLGIFVAAANDVNGDSYSDVIVGERGSDNKGVAYIFFGGL
jgi:hypothetical protein